MELKNKVTWYTMLGHLLCRVRYNPGEHSRDGGTDGTVYVNRNSHGSRVVRCLCWNDDEWDWNYNWLDNDFNDNNPAAVLAR